jgi:hypothetical protein
MSLPLYSTENTHRLSASTHSPQLTDSVVGGRQLAGRRSAAGTTAGPGPVPASVSAGLLSAVTVVAAAAAAVGFNGSRNSAGLQRVHTISVGEAHIAIAQKLCGE